MKFFLVVSTSAACTVVRLLLNQQAITQFQHLVMLLPSVKRFIHGRPRIGANRVS